VGSVVDKVALGQVFSEYFGLPCQSSFHQFLNNHHHLSSGAGTIGQWWPQYQETQSHPTKNNNKKNSTGKLTVTISFHLPSKSSFSHSTIAYSWNGVIK
jgi:hypothetical protein